MRRDAAGVHVVESTRPLPGPPDAVIDALAPAVTPARLARLEAVAARRCRSAVVVMESVIDPHNGSAVLRSADAFGLQEVHVVEGDQPFRAAPGVTRGADRWLEVVRHADARACADALHARGYRLYVAAMDGALRPEDLRPPARVAIVFGNEHHGVSGGMWEHADASYAVPMAGFVESLNVSVAAAITLYEATRGRHGELDAAGRREILARFLLATVHEAERRVAEHLARR